MSRESNDATARQIAEAIGLRVSLVHHGDRRCPPWENPCTHIHGDHYRVTLTRTKDAQENGGARRLGFDYWNSLHDVQTGKTPSDYDILVCVASDASGPTDPDEVAEEYGLKPSVAIAAAKFSARLQRFFTGDDLTKLGEIQ